MGGCGRRRGPPSGHNLISYVPSSLIGVSYSNLQEKRGKKLATREETIRELRTLYFSSLVTSPVLKPKNRTVHSSHDTQTKYRYINTVFIYFIWRIWHPYSTNINKATANNPTHHKMCWVFNIDTTSTRVLLPACVPVCAEKVGLAAEGAEPAAAAAVAAQC